MKSLPTWLRKLSNDFLRTSRAIAPRPQPMRASRFRCEWLEDRWTPAVGDLVLTINNPTPAGFDQFGYSVAAVGNNVLVGAVGDSTGGTNSGAAYLFDGSNGALLHTFTNPTPAVDDFFGLSVAAVGNNVLVS